MSYANTNKIQAAVMVLDQEKAFDRMDWNFLFKALQNFEYGPEVTQKIKTVYQNLETQVKINGRAFPVKRGLPWGCQLPMILYILFEETNLENIRQSNRVKVIVIGKKELKTFVFAVIHNNAEAHLMHFEKATA